MTMEQRTYLDALLALPYEEKVKVYYALNEWRWPESLGEAPEGWASMGHGDKHAVIRPISLSIRLMVGEKATLRYLHTHKLGETDRQFEDWWDSRDGAEKTLEELDKLRSVNHKPVKGDAQKHKRDLKPALALSIGALAMLLLLFLLKLI